MTVRSALPILIAAFALTAAAYMAITPNFAFGALLNAAASGDDRLLGRVVDEAAVRANLTEQARSAAASAVPAPLAGVAQALGAGVSAAFADAVLAPPALRELLGVAPSSGLDTRAIRALHDSASREYRAWDRFAFTSQSPLLGTDVTYLFGRAGLGWVLIAIEF